MDEINVDQFVGRVRENNGSLVVAIPKNNVIFSGLTKGQLVKVWFKKQNEPNK